MEKRMKEELGEDNDKKGEEGISQQQNEEKRKIRVRQS